MHKYLMIIGVILLTAIVGCNNNSDLKQIEESGTIETINVVVGSKVSGTVLKLNIEEGTELNKGDTLLIVDPEIYELKLAQSNASLKVAKAQFNLLTSGSRKEDKLAAKENYNQAKAHYELMEKNYKRMSALLKSETITESKFDESEAAFKVAESKLTAAKENLAKINNIARIEELDAAEANIKMAEVSVNLAKKALHDCYITSPLNGKVIKSYIEEGENVSQMSSIVKISNLEKIELKVYVSELDLGKVKVGQKAEISVDSFPDEVFTGKVVFISPEAEFTPKSIQTKDERTKLVFAVKVALENSEEKLKAGMPADAKIILDK